MTTTDSRALRASIRERDRIYAAAYDAGLRGEPYLPEWGDTDDVADAYRAGVDDRARDRHDRRAARFESYRRRAVRATRRPRVRRWRRRHPYAAAGVLAVLLVALAALGAIAGLALALRWAWRGLAWLVRAARAAVEARRAPVEGIAPLVPLAPGEDPF